MRFRGIVLLLAILACGCVTEMPREHEFSREWAGHVKHEDEFKARKDRIEKHGKVLLGKKDSKGLRVESGDSGKPGLKLGGKSGLNADVKVGGNTGGTVSYGIRW